MFTLRVLETCCCPREKKAGKGEERFLLLTPKGLQIGGGPHSWTVGSSLFEISLSARCFGDASDRTLSLTGVFLPSRLKCRTAFEFSPEFFSQWT